MCTSIHSSQLSAVGSCYTRALSRGTDQYTAYQIVFLMHNTQTLGQARPTMFYILLVLWLPLRNLDLNLERSLFFNCMSQLVHSWHTGSLQRTPLFCKVLFALQLRIRTYGCFSFKKRQTRVWSVGCITAGLLFTAASQS